MYESTVLKLCICYELLKLKRKLVKYSNLTFCSNLDALIFHYLL